MSALAHAPSDPRPAGPAYRAAVLTLVALGVGALASLAAIGLTDAVLWLNDALLISPRTRVQIEGRDHLVQLATVAVPAAGGLLVAALLRLAAPEGRPLGPPDVIRAVQFERPLPSLQGGMASTLAAMISLGFGASVGQYGPMVYLGAMLGGLVRRLRLRVPNLPSIAVACGVAAAISTAFNAPIAGLVFAHEVVLRHWSTQSFAPTTVAAAIGYVFANVIFQRPALFLVKFEGVQHGYEFALFAVLGLLAAALAIAFMRLLLWVAAQAPRSGIPALLRPAAAGLAVGLTALWLPDVLGIGKEVLRFATIEGAFGAGELAVLVAAKLALTALCIGFGFAGGVFSPALLIGILSGAFFWTMLDSTGLATSGVAVYAICGMMALTSPVIGAPLATILIVFELTRNYDITIAAMVAVVFSNILAHRVFGRSLFDVQLARRGADLSAGRDRARLTALRVRDYVMADAPVARIDAVTPAALRRRLAASDWTEGYVTDAEGRFRGVLRADAAATGWDEALHAPALQFHEDTTVMEALQALRGFLGEAVPVVHRGDGRLIGVVSESAVIAAYLDVSTALRREENAVL